MIPTADAPVESAPRLESIEPARVIPPAQDTPETFDPYGPWLGIADSQRPFNYYVLLGLDPGECDPERIRVLVLRQMDRVLAHVRHLFAELEAARDCLCDPQKRQEYDAQLRERASAGLSAAAIPTADAAVEPAPRLESIEPACVIPPAPDTSETFDPYREWLGIADQERPLNHYVLLGLDPGESDRDKVWRSAQLQIDRILGVDPSLVYPHSRRLFDEVEAARDCLCNPQTREEYEAQLLEWAPAGLVPFESEPFDPYSEWLGIIDPCWPLNYYVLLGVDPGESDREKIWSQAERQIDRIREVDPSLECPHVRHIFEELEAARDCLSNPQTRQEYDAQLCERASAGLSPAAIPTADVRVAALVEPAPRRLESIDPSCMILPEEDLPVPVHAMPIEPGPRRLESIDPSCMLLPEDDLSEFFGATPVEPVPARLESIDPSCMILPEEDLPVPVHAMPIEPGPRRLESIDPSCMILPEDDPSEFFGATPVEPVPARLQSNEPACVIPPAQDTSEPFDPYREWLGISDQERPLNHYLLLGLTPYETDLAKIDEISLRQMARVLERDSALNTETGVCLFGELDAARNCLCDPQQKQAYDAWLHEGRTGEPSAGGRMGTTSSAAPVSSFNLAPPVSAVPHKVGDERMSSSIATAAAATISRHVDCHDAPEPARPPAPVPWYVRHSHLALAVVAGVLVMAALANYPTNRKPQEDDLVPALLAKLNHSNPRQRIEAAQALRELGPQASIGLPHMVRVLSGEINGEVRLAVARAVREFGPATAIYRRDFEIIKTKEPNSDVREILNELTKE